jgi:hypothetical protein
MFSYKFRCNFYTWIRIRILNADPDPATQIYADPCGSGSATLLNCTGTGTLYLFVRVTKMALRK